MKKKKLIKKYKESLIAEIITPYTATCFSFEDLYEHKLKWNEIVSRQVSGG